MINETNQVEDAVDEVAELPEVVEGDEDLTDWKAEALKQQGIAKRFKTKLEKAKEAAKEVKPDLPIENKPSDLTDGQKALFVAYGIKSKAEIALGKEVMAKLQINNVDDLVEDDYFNSRLTKLRNETIAKEAVPSNTGRSASSQGNKLDYWAAKYLSTGNLNEVPKELQRDVLNARLASEENKRKFGG